MDVLAITQTTFGGPEVLTPTRIPRPRPIPSEVLVRVHATAVNPIDRKIRAQNVIPSMFADEVFGMPRLPKAGRTYAEFVTAPTRHLARIPAGLDHAHAAALPMVGLTAWQALVDTADLRAGRRVGRPRGRAGGGRRRGVGRVDDGPPRAGEAGRAGGAGCVAGGGGSGVAAGPGGGGAPNQRGKLVLTP